MPKLNKPKAKRSLPYKEMRPSTPATGTEPREAATVPRETTDDDVVTLKDPLQILIDELGIGILEDPDR